MNPPVSVSSIDPSEATTSTTARPLVNAPEYAGSVHVTDDAAADTLPQDAPPTVTLVTFPRDDPDTVKVPPPATGPEAPANAPDPNDTDVTSGPTA